MQAPPLTADLKLTQTQAKGSFSGMMVLFPVTVTVMGKRLGGLPGDRADWAPANPESSCRWRSHQNAGRQQAAAGDTQLPRLHSVPVLA